MCPLPSRARPGQEPAAFRVAWLVPDRGHAPSPPPPQRVHGRNPQQEAGKDEAAEVYKAIHDRARAYFKRMEDGVAQWPAP